MSEFILCQGLVRFDDKFKTVVRYEICGREGTTHIDSIKIVYSSPKGGQEKTIHFFNTNDSLPIGMVKESVVAVGKRSGKDIEVNQQAIDFARSLLVGCHFKKLHHLLTAPNARNVLEAGVLIQRFADNADLFGRRIDAVLGPEKGPRPMLHFAMLEN